MKEKIYYYPLNPTIGSKFEEGANYSDCYALVDRKLLKIRLSYVLLQKKWKQRHGTDANYSGWYDLVLLYTNRTTAISNHLIVRN